MADYPKTQPQLRLECEVVSVTMDATRAGKPVGKVVVNATAQRIALPEYEDKATGLTIPARTVRIPFPLPALELRAWQANTVRDLLPGDRLLCEVALSVWLSPAGYRNLQAKAEDIKVLARAQLPPREPEAARQDAPTPEPPPEPPHAPATRQEPAGEAEADADDIPF